MVMRQSSSPAEIGQQPRAVRNSSAVVVGHKMLSIHRVMRWVCAKVSTSSGSSAASVQSRSKIVKYPRKDSIAQGKKNTAIGNKAGAQDIPSPKVAQQAVQPGLIKAAVGMFADVIITRLRCDLGRNAQLDWLAGVKFDRIDVWLSEITVGSNPRLSPSESKCRPVDFDARAAVGYINHREANFRPAWTSGTSFSSTICHQASSHRVLTRSLASGFSAAW